MISADAKLGIRMLVVWVIGLAALVVFHFAFVARQAQAVNACRQQAAAKADRFAFLKAAKSAHEQDRLAQAQKELEQQYGDFVFTGEQLSELDFEMRTLAQKNNLQDFSARRAGTAGKIAATPLKQIAQQGLILSFNSTFPDVLRFINELERHSPILIVDQFTLTSGSEKGGTLSCMLDCSLLYQVTASTAPAATAQ